MAGLALLSQRLPARHRSRAPNQWFALVDAFLGDETDTVKWLTRSADRHEWQALNLGVHPAYAGMRDSAGFRALRKRIGPP
jgi:hypothetical protein